jgi:hypothetical protein
MLQGEETWGEGFKAVRAILIRVHQIEIEHETDRALAQPLTHAGGWYCQAVCSVWWREHQSR